MELWSFLEARTSKAAAEDFMLRRDTLLTLRLAKNLMTLSCDVIKDNSNFPSTYSRTFGEKGNSNPQEMIFYCV